MIESIVAFLLVLLSSSLIYLSSRLVVQKTKVSEEKLLTYACGEKMMTKKLSVTISLYRYLIFFVIIDSPVLVMAFAALALDAINPLSLLIYLSFILIADFLLLGDY